MKKIFFSIIFFVSCAFSTVDDNEDDFFQKYNNISCINIYEKNYDKQNINYTRNIYLVKNSLSNIHIYAAIEAAYNWNMIMNYKIFNIVFVEKIPEKLKCGSIIVETIKDVDYSGYAEWSKCLAKIKIKNTIDNVLVYMHEFGHALNLNHENDIKSVMYPRIHNQQKISQLSQCLTNLSILDSEQQNILNIDKINTGHQNDSMVLSSIPGTEQEKNCFLTM